VSLFRAPRHPYTYGLLNSFPPMHGERARMTGIPGSPPDLRAVPSGCAFHPRCPHAMDRCSAEVPLLAPLTPSPLTPSAPTPSPPTRPGGTGRREVACWLHDQAAPVPIPAELNRPDPAPPNPAAAPADPAAARTATADDGGTS
jgi:peptide/nickel transport system ATP-binding protein